MTDLTAQVQKSEGIPAPEGLRQKVLGGIDFRGASKPRARRSYVTSPVAVAILLFVVVCAAAVLLPTFSGYKGAMEAPRVAVTPEPKVAQSPAEPSEASPERRARMSAKEDTAGVARKVPGAVPGVNQLIIKTADMSLQVKSFQKAYDRAVSTAKSAGGYVTDSSAETEGTRPTSGNLTLRVPVDSFERTLDRLGDLGKVLSKNIRGEDVTAEVVDLNSRMRNQRAEERQYLEIMNRAKRVTDVVTVSNELYRVRGEIEQAEGRVKYLNSVAEMATINLNLSEKAKPEPVKGSSIKNTFTAAFTSLGDTANGLARVLVWIAVYSPFWLLPLATALYLRRRALATTQ